MLGYKGTFSAVNMIINKQVLMIWGELYLVC